MYGWSPEVVGKLTPQQIEMYLGEHDEQVDGRGRSVLKFKTAQEAQEYIASVR